MEGDRGSDQAVHVAQSDTIVAVPEPSAQALEYYRVGNALWAADLAWGFVVLALFLWLGWSARIRDLAYRIGRGRVRATLVYIAVFGLLAALFALPLDFIRGYVVEHRFGLSEQALSKWLSDQALAFAIGLATTFASMVVIYELLRRSPRRWWIYAGAAALPFFFALYIVSPIWVAPLFNKFGPMKDAALERKIDALAARAGIEGARIFEVDKSVDTNKPNAYATGVLGTRRIVIWDTAIKRFDERQLLVVMGHEIGHYVLGHVYRGLVIQWLLTFLALYVTYRVANGLLARHRARFGFERLDDIASWPLILLVTAAVFLVTDPLYYAVTRYDEHEADRFALEITHDNRAAAEAFIKLQQGHLAVPRPDPILHILRDSHPTLAERIDFANSYRPWATGAPLVYGDKFRQ